jgi:hypothetical protein
MNPKRVLLAVEELENRTVPTLMVTSPVEVPQ